MTYTVKPQQSLFDIAIEVYGDVEGSFWLIEDNPGISLTERLRPAQVLAIRADQVNPRQATYLQDFGPFQTIDEADRPNGIGYWYLDEYIIQ